jgi:hypothetical protein
MNKKALSKFTEPKIAGLLMSVCVADAVYMLSLYQVTSNSLISMCCSTP